MAMKKVEVFLHHGNEVTVVTEFGAYVVDLKDTPEFHVDVMRDGLHYMVRVSIEDITPGYTKEERKRDERDRESKGGK